MKENKYKVRQAVYCFLDGEVVMAFVSAIQEESADINSPLQYRLRGWDKWIPENKIFDNKFALINSVDIRDLTVNN